MSISLEDALNELAPQLGGKSTTDMARLSGGASQETWAFKLDDGAGNLQKCILRRAPGGELREQSSTDIQLSDEAALIKAASAHGVEVPSVLHVCTEVDGLGAGFIMAHVEGETIARKILRDEKFQTARANLARQCGQALARIHSIPTDNLPEVLPVTTGADQIAKYEEIYRSFNIPRPVFELALSWLKDNTPPELKPVLVHGDFRLGNLMVNETGLAAVLDWELSHIGDPREDIGWICVNSWRFGVTEKRVGGFGDLKDLLHAYADAGGQSFSETDIDWWEILGSLKWGIMCMIMYEAFRSGSDPSVERAASGRRVSETEIDLVNLLEKASQNA